MFLLCLLAMIMLHKALLKVMQIFFDNFQSDFRGPEVTSNLQTCDVEHNSEILQFNIAALYQLQPSWMSTYVHTHTSVFDVHSKNATGLGAYCVFSLSQVMSASLFPAR